MALWGSRLWREGGAVSWGWGDAPGCGSSLCDSREQKWAQSLAVSSLARRASSYEAGKRNMEDLGAEGRGLLAPVPQFMPNTIIQESL